MNARILTSVYIFPDMLYAFSLESILHMFLYIYAHSQEQIYKEKDISPLIDNKTLLQNVHKTIL